MLASARYEQPTVQDDRSISTATSVIKSDAKLHKMVYGQKKKVAATLSTSPNVSCGMGYLASKGISPVKPIGFDHSSPQNRHRGVFRLFICSI